MVDRRAFLRTAGAAASGLLLPSHLLAGRSRPPAGATRPNIVLIMTDDQGWGQTGYYNHPVLRTPNLDAMAANGLRFDRFYAAAPVCSPTRASVLTGRTPNRTGVLTHGYALRRQEKTLPVALKAAGYTTGHFGKWHLNGLRGPGVPVLGDDAHSPGAFGFDEWLTVTNFFDTNPIMSRKGAFEEFEGDTSAVIVHEAMKFIRSAQNNEKPFLAVIWDGSPHKPWRASDADREAFDGLPPGSQHHYGELAAFDRSVGALRSGLRDLGIADNTLVWYCSDNGGLKGLTPDSVGGLRGYKSSLWEGGIRVPGIIEWPDRIRPRVTDYPASTMDIFPTIAGILDLADSAHLDPVDGTSLVPLLTSNLPARRKPIPFRYRSKGALIDNDLKLLAANVGAGKFGLYDLAADPTESRDISADSPEVFSRMRSEFEEWNASVDNSTAGRDYPEGRVLEGEPKPHFWMEDDRYRPYFQEWQERQEYSRALKPKSE